MDNRFYRCGCPALMSDGRLVTNYLDNDVFNHFIAKSNKLNTSNQYRAFLQKNGSKIIGNERMFFTKKNVHQAKGECAKCIHCCEK
jgi:hypothetical protein